MHWATMARTKKMLLAQVRGQLNLPQNMPNKELLPLPRRVHYEVLRCHRIDTDNMVGGLKPLQDCLQEAGVLWSDDPMWCMTSYEQGRIARGLPERVHIYIWDADEYLWSDEQRRLVARIQSARRDSMTTSPKAPAPLPTISRHGKNIIRMNRPR
jgi:Holliday junction resolvase RusA-like endonuclease